MNIDDSFQNEQQQTPAVFNVTSKSSIFHFDLLPADMASSPPKSLDDNNQFDGFEEFDTKYGSVNLEVSDKDLMIQDDILESALQSMKSATKSHMIGVKRRLLDEKRHALLALEEEHATAVNNLQNEISSLKQVIQSLESNHDAKVAHVNAIQDNLSVILCKNHHVYASKYSLMKVFNAWRRCSQSSKFMTKLEKTAVFFHRKGTLNRTMSCMRANFANRKSLRLQTEAKNKFDSVTDEMVVKYESELSRLNEELREARLIAESESNKRQHLESDLRRMFLKNMTHMNMEALSLFHDNYTETESAKAIEAATALDNSVTVTEPDLGLQQIGMLDVSHLGTHNSHSRLLKTTTEDEDGTPRLSLPTPQHFYSSNGYANNLYNAQEMSDAYYSQLMPPPYQYDRLPVNGTPFAMNADAIAANSTPLRTVNYAGQVRSTPNRVQAPVSVNNRYASSKSITPIPARVEGVSSASKTPIAFKSNVTASVTRDNRPSHYRS